jgi:hypothetical protein
MRRGEGARSFQSWIARQIGAGLLSEQAAFPVSSHGVCGQSDEGMWPPVDLSRARMNIAR